MSLTDMLIVFLAKYIPNGRGGGTPKLRRNMRTPVGSLGKELGADSPTQLQLLGSDLIGGLLSESPRTDSMLVGTTRYIRALNLVSPSELAVSLVPEILIYLTFSMRMLRSF